MQISEFEEQWVMNKKWWISVELWNHLLFCSGLFQLSGNSEIPTNK